MNIIKNFWSNRKSKSIVIIFLTIIFSFLFISFILMIFNINPLQVYNILFLLSFNDIDKTKDLLNVFSYLLLASMASLVSFRFKVYNLGVIGQMLIASIIVFIISRLLANVGFNNKFLIFFFIILAMLSGGAFALISGLLKKYFKINEMASTLLLNFFALSLYSNLHHWSQYQDGIINNNASLIVKFTTTISLSIALFIALFVFGFINILLDRRVFGFRLELVSVNKRVAEYARLNPKDAELLIIVISGILAGLAGYIHYVGTYNKIVPINSLILLKMDNLLIAMWSFNSRIGIIFITIFLSFIRSQSQFLNFTNFDIAIVNIIISLLLVISTISSYIILWKKEPRFLIRMRFKELIKNNL